MPCIALCYGTLRENTVCIFTGFCIISAFFTLTCRSYFESTLAFLQGALWMDSVRVIIIDWNLICRTVHARAVFAHNLSTLTGGYCAWWLDSVDCNWDLVAWTFHASCCWIYYLPCRTILHRTNRCNSFWVVSLNLICWTELTHSLDVYLISLLAFWDLARCGFSVGVYLG